MQNIFNIPKKLLDAINQVLLSEHSMTNDEVSSIERKFNSEISAHKIAANAISGNIFGASDRIILPISHEEHPTKTSVENHLHQNGFHSTDYRAGVTKDAYNRTVSIGKALTKTNAQQQLLNDFAKHQKTYANDPDTSDLQIVISKHPYDVVGMSQGTAWGVRDNQECDDVSDTQSCMRFGTPQHEQHIPSELIAGTHIAWLTKKGDNEAKNPISRIKLLPYDKFEPSVDNTGKTFKLKLAKRSDMYVQNQHEHGKQWASDIFPMSIDDSADDSKDLDINKHYVGTRVHSETPYHVTYAVDFASPITHDKFKQFAKSIAQKFNAPESAIGTTTESGDTIQSRTTKKIAHTILVPSAKSYGKHSDDFRATVKKWSNQHFSPQKKSTYISRSGVYLDGDDRKIET